jgi:multicomponent Na+:H+ antiporter subunit G
MILDLLSWISLLCGAFFLIVGCAGTLRMPDFYTRLHAAGVADTLGATLLLLGLALQAGPNLVAVKLVMIWLFMWLTGPTASHALAKAAFADPHNPKPLLHEEAPPSKS